jgi:predicted HTH domain antitoxin
MIDQELTVEIVVEMYEDKIVILKKEIDRLNEEIQVLHIELMQERTKNEIKNA